MMKLRRLSQLGLGAGLATMVLGAMMAIAPVAGADHNPGHAQDPHGNNGTVKIDGLHPVDGPGHSTAPNPDEDLPDNDPHVMCAFELEFFGFDEGQTADVLISAHPPTGSGEILAGGPGVDPIPISHDPAGGAGNDLDVVTEPYDLTEALIDSGIEPHDVHGFHVKLDLTIYRTNPAGQQVPVPGGQKHKVFWIEDCLPEPEPEPEPEMGIELVKTNDANRNQTFTDQEQAPAASSDVTFRLDITNTGDTDLTIASLDDTWPGQGDDALDLLAEDLECSRGDEDVSLDEPLPARTTTTCFFTVEDYAPPAGSPLVNTVVVTTDEGPDDEDTSTVTSPELTYSIDLIKENDADRNEDFSNSEEAPTADASVPFQIVLENTGTGDLTVESLVDTWGEDEELDLLDPGAVDLQCTRGEGEAVQDVDLVTDPVLPAGSTTTCTFTVDGYAPDAGDSLVNTVTVTTGEGPGADDTSTVSTPPANPTFSVDLEKLNNANGDSTFSGQEQATAPGAAVPFQITIENTGTGHLTLESLVDTWGQDGELDLLDPDTALSCTRGGSGVDLEEGSTLPAGSVTVCTFTIAGYAPPAGGSITNTVVIDTVQLNPVDDDSTVTTPGSQTVPPPPPPPTATFGVSLDKLNDADDDGDFSVSETADDAGDDVVFQITIRNTGTGSLVLQSLTDRVPGRATINLLGDDVDLVCTSGVTDLRAGSLLPAGSTTVCTFELDDYAPGASDSLTNTVTVVTDQVSDTDTSTVETDEEIAVLPAPPVVNPPTPGTPPPAVVPVGGTPIVAPVPVVAPQQPAPQVRGDVVTRALPRTGGDSWGMTGMGAFLIAVGAAMVLGSRRRLAPR